MRKTPKTLKQLTQDLGQTFEAEEVVSLIVTINDDVTFREMYKKRISGTEGEVHAKEIVKILKECANKGTDIQAHIESLIRFENNL